MLYFLCVEKSLGRNSLNFEDYFWGNRVGGGGYFIFILIFWYREYFFFIIKFVLFL